MSKKVLHEIRDVIHTFVYFNNDEKKVIGSRYFQRLRHIKQLSMTNYVYPGAVHTRFEHSIGTMELAGRAFDVLFDRKNRHSKSVEQLKEQLDDNILVNWRCHLRMAALLHDVGHPPFSHATESLFPVGENHETMTKKIIMESELTDMLQNGCDIPYNPSLIAKLAVGPKYFQSEPFKNWQLLLNEIIVGDAFGVDRMDYLLRDAHHCGAVAGKFDHDRLIQTLRILLPPRKIGERSEISIGIEHGGIHPTEALLVARYFMYMQVYFHRVSTAYNTHCERFVEAFLKVRYGGFWPIDPDNFIKFTDNEILSEIYEASQNRLAVGYLEAKRIQDRNHFQLAYEFRPKEIHMFAVDRVKAELENKLASEFTETDYSLILSRNQGGKRTPALKDDFSVWNRRVEPDKIEFGKTYSKILDKLVSPSQDFVIADRQKKNDIKTCIEEFIITKMGKEFLEDDNE